MPHLLSLPTCTLKKTLLLIASLLFTALVVGFRSLWHFDSPDQAVPTGVVAGRLQPLALQLLTPAQNDSQSLAWKWQCNFHTCFEINNCVLDVDQRIGVYVYPEYVFTDGNQSWDVPQSKEYREILSAIRTSVFYQPDPNRACVFVPSVDTLNQRGMNISLMSAMMASLPHWNNGSNHLIFSMLAGQPPHYNQTPDFQYEKAILAASSFHPHSYRINFDIAIPVYNALTQSDGFPDRAHKWSVHCSWSTITTGLLRVPC